MNIRILTLLATTACVAPLLPACSSTPTTSPTVQHDGNVGLTNYETLPFMSQVYWQSWGSSPSLAPGNLFWQYGSWFTNKTNTTNAQGAAASYDSHGIVPASGAQRWEDTFEAAQPASQFPGEPSWIAADRNSNCCSTPEFTAWVNWIKARPNLPMMASDGGTTGNDFRPWKGSWGHISPLMPLAQADCPSGMTSCVYGDLYAYQWGQTAALSGAYGIMLSDFSDSQPSQLSIQEGFNPEIIAAFSAAEKVAVPSGTIAQESAWITANALNQWNDYLAMGYGHFYNALAQRLAAATNHPSLVIDQCGDWPSLRRFYGTDQRIFANEKMNSQNYVCIWDDQTMQLGRSGVDPVWGVGGYAIAAAREPSMRNGANLEANDANYWQAIKNFNPTLSSADQQEKGLKLMKRSWLEGSWAHIANRRGQVRRAMSFMSRDYWDAGTLDPTLQSLISTIIPEQPFGMAVYYSTAAERAEERTVSMNNLVFFYSPNELLALKNAGAAVDYYVSDAALPALQPAAKPAAWIILEHPELIPAAEMSALQAVAPVLTTIQQIQSFANAPLAYSSGLTGLGFYDQHHRLIVTATNPSTNTVNGTITLGGLAVGTYNMLDLFANTTTTFTVSSSKVAVPVSVTRWDTMAFAITRAS